MDAANIWKNVKSEIKRTKTTQKTLADKIGISLGNLQQQIHHKRIPDAIEIFYIAKALHTSVEHLINGEEIDAEFRVLEGFRQLSSDDKDEIIEIIKIKNVKKTDKSTDKQSKGGKDTITRKKDA
jgi:transcriptional regulator with XRE-family HTH domain